MDVFFSIFVMVFSESFIAPFVSPGIHHVVYLFHIIVADKYESVTAQLVYTVLIMNRVFAPDIPTRMRHSSDDDYTMFVNRMFDVKMSGTTLINLERILECVFSCTLLG